MLHTTLALLHQHGACTNGYRKLVRHLGGSKAWPADRPIPLTTVLDSNGCDDAVWCLRAVLPAEAALCERIARLFAADCAEAVLPLFERDYPDDDRPRRAIEAARAFAHDKIDVAALGAANDAARDAALAAARDAAWAAAMAAARGAANDAALAAGRGAAWDAAMAAAWGAAWDAAWAAQATILRQHLETASQEMEG